MGLCALGFAARERILSNLQKHPVPQSAPELQTPKPPVAKVPAACLTDPKAAAELVQQDLDILQEQARCVKLQSANKISGKVRFPVGPSIVTSGFISRIAVAREAQQVATEQELLESLPLLYKNQPEQVTMALECKGKGGQPCQGPANLTVTVWQQKQNIFVFLYIFY